MPAPPQGMLQLYVPHRDWGRMSGRYLRDLQPDAESLVWDFELRGYDRGIPVQFTLDEAGLPAGVRVFVLNNSEGTATELPLPNQLEWTPTRSVTSLRIVATRRNEPAPPGTDPVDIALIRTPRASPNPFRAQTTFTVELDAPGEVSVLVFDTHGRRVRELITSESQIGEIDIPWDGKDDNGNDLPSGVYLMRSRGPSRTASLRVVKID